MGFNLFRGSIVAVCDYMLFPCEQGVSCICRRARCPSRLQYRTCMSNICKKFTVGGLCVRVGRVLLQMNALLSPVRAVPGCHAVMFGSLPAGLSLPDSDVDVVLLQERPPFPPPPPAEGFTHHQKKIVVNQLTEVRCHSLHKDPSLQHHVYNILAGALTLCRAHTHSCAAQTSCVHHHSHAFMYRSSTEFWAA